MTAKEAVNWIINIMADIGKSEHRALWHYEQALMEIREMLETSAQPDIIRCRNCKFASGDSRICMKFGHSPIGELDFCAWAERRTDEV